MGNQFEQQYPNDQRIWKQLTFAYLVKKHYAMYRHCRSNKPFCVVSIGDSEHEYVASKLVINRFNAAVLNNGHQKILLHRVKLLRNPSIAQLIEQYNLLKKVASFFATEMKEIDIDYERERLYYRALKLHKKRHAHH